MEKDMIQWFISAFGSSNEHIQISFNEFLADVLPKLLGPQILINGKVFRFSLAADNSFFFDHASDLNVSRINSSTRISARDSGAIRLFTSDRAI